LILTNPRDAFVSEMDQIGLRIPGPISDIGPVGTKIFDFENVVTSKRGLGQSVIKNDTLDHMRVSVIL